jgi:hypothetical protein
MLFANAGQPVLNPPREFFLPGQLDFRVSFSHSNRAVASDFGRFDARTA